MELVWLIANDCDFHAAKTLLRHRVPMLEYAYIKYNKVLGRNHYIFLWFFFF